MTISGTAVFDLSINEAIDEAFERIGIEARAGYEYRSARRSLSLMLLEWSNRGLNLWTVSERILPLVSGVGQYTLGSDIVDVIEQMVQLPAQGNSGVIRYNLTRVSVSTQATRTNPGISGRPTEVWFDRQQAAPIANIWPLPDNSNGVYNLVYWCLTRIDDPGAYTNTSDVPFRFLPVLIAGLAYYLSVKFLATQRNDTRWSVMFTEQRIIRLKQDYEDAWIAASQEDREKATLMQVPRGSSYRV